MICTGPMIKNRSTQLKISKTDEQDNCQGLPFRKTPANNRQPHNNIWHLEKDDSKYTWEYLYLTLHVRMYLVPTPTKRGGGGG